MRRPSNLTALRRNRTILRGDRTTRQIVRKLKVASKFGREARATLTCACHPRRQRRRHIREPTQECSHRGMQKPFDWHAREQQLGRSWHTRPCHLHPHVQRQKVRTLQSGLMGTAARPLVHERIPNVLQGQRDNRPQILVEHILHNHSHTG